MPELMPILAINAGSSSIKFAVYDPRLTLRLRGEVEDLDGVPRLSATGASGEPLAVPAEAPAVGGSHAMIGWLTAWIEDRLGGERPAAIGHRVAIGGLEHSQPALVTPKVMETLKALVPLAPLHQPRNLEPIDSLREVYPDVPQVACFDTAFHRTLPRVAQLYGLPRSLSEAGAVRYGFHGLSYEYIARCLPHLDQRAARGRTVVAHLGSGASMCAMRAGRSVATTMGFSPLSGLVMATRPGDLDPGLVIWLIRELGMSVDEVEDMLYRRSGLIGVSGVSGDMRALLESSDPHAAEAVELFTYRAAMELAALATALGGLDALVFTGGIGEHSAAIRHAICTRAQWLGLRLSDAANEKGDSLISRGDGGTSVWVVPTNEELMVAGHAAHLALRPAPRMKEPVS